MTSEAKEEAISVQWIAARNGEIPPGALQAGSEEGKPLYICRAAHGGGQHPGKIRGDFDGCHIAWGGQEVVITTYEVLVAYSAETETPASPACSEAAIKVYALADAIPSDSFSLFLKDGEKVQIRDAAIEIRNLALGCGCLDLVDQAERLKALSGEHMPSREDAVNRLKQMKNAVTACLKAATVIASAPKKP